MIYDKSIYVRNMRIFKDNKTDDPLECINRAISKLNGLYVILDYRSTYNRLVVKKDLNSYYKEIKCFKKEIKRFKKLFNIDKTKEFKDILIKFNKLKEKVSEG